ncbi:MAG TPA: tetratricopeptide repeat protein [Opitutaceae bacterium]|nr:tetratricopeptide repeat protein [Opitutaceae bacterium]
MSGRTAFPPRSAPVALAGALIAIAAVLAYGNSLHGAFVLDDPTSILDNASIRSLWPPRAVLFPPLRAGDGGRPIANLSFALNYAVSGRDPWSYHALALALHALAALTLFGIVRRTLLLPALAARYANRATPLAATVAALWALHPLTTSTVDYLSQRTEQLMALFYLLTLYAFVRSVELQQSENKTLSPATAWRFASVAACLLAVASKEVAVTAPLLVVLYDRTFVAGGFRTALRQRWKYYLGLAAAWILLAALMIDSRVTQRGIGFDGHVSALHYAASECHAVLVYLRLAAWPAPLVFDYGWAFLGPREALPFAAALASLLLASTLLWRRWPALGFLAAAWFLILAPTSSVVPILEQPIAESRAYLPLAAFVALAVFVAHAALARFRRGVALALTLTIAVALGATTFRRNEDYRSAISLWSDAAAKQPANPRAQNNLASVLLDAGQPAAALAPARRALELRPAYPQAHTNLGKALGDLGDAAEAIAHYRAAIALDATLPEAHGNLGTALLRAGATAEAIPEFQAALRLQPDLLNVHNNLAVALLRLGRVDAAIIEAEAALRLDPQFADAHYTLADARIAQGRIPDAIAHLIAALAARPNFPRAENRLGALLLQSGHRTEAIAHFEAALRLQPDFPEAQRNLEAARRLASPRD